MSSIRFGSISEGWCALYDRRITISISEKDRFRSVLFIGAPGSGKSVGIEIFCQQDLLMKTALVLIDPSGELARRVYSHAKVFKREVIYLSKENPCTGLNLMMAPLSVEQRAELVLAYINHITLTTSSDLSATTRMRNAIYDVVIWCIENGRPRLDALLDRLRKKQDPKNQHAIDGVISRLESILSDPAVRDILCMEKAVNFLELAERKRVLIVDTFGLGELPGVAVGSALTFLLKESFLAVRREVVHPLALYIDEAHLFIDQNFFHLLKMARKYKVMTTLATQDFASVPQTFKQVLLSNVGSIIALNPGAREAREIAPEFKDLSDKEVKFTEKYHAAVKTPAFEGIVKMNRPPFVKVLPLPVKTVEKRPMWFVTT